MNERWGKRRYARGWHDETAVKIKPTLYFASGTMEKLKEEVKSYRSLAEFIEEAVLAKLGLKGKRAPGDME